mmetsp:Transcript_20535/g.28811  ORF Transcript_20535/g.28811 Transcript_20535/m.28811 type:complete len:475 (-) Transcript_20535:892-2316(-)
MDYLQEGLSLVTKAVQFDTDGRIQEAVEYYEKAVVNLEQAAKVEKDSQRRNLINEKVIEYRARYSQLQDKITKQEITSRMSKLGVGTLPSLVMQQKNNENDMKNNPASQPIINETHNPPVMTPPSFAVPDYIPPSMPSYEAIPSGPVFGQPPQPELERKQSYSVITPVSGYGMGVINPTQPNPIIAPAPVPSPSSIISTLASPSSMSKVEAFTTGTELAQKGKFEDEHNRHQNALAYYKAALDYLVRAMQEETNESTKSKMRENVMACLKRAEQLSANIEFAKSERSDVLLCGYCKQPIETTAPYKVTKDNSYHINCLELSVGLAREASKTFFGSKPLRLKVQLQKKTFSAGENTLLDVLVDNQSGKKVASVKVYVLRTETWMHVVMGAQGSERKARTKTTKLGAKEYKDQFPLEVGTVHLDSIIYKIPENLESTEVSGISAAFAREYELIVKCVVPAPHSPLKLPFPIIIGKP